ncbi:DoxX family protein [Pseudochryseolinea flava]|uniref:DoxX family protein n=1 Tax=Pseudochryseolinea flava TaxID=2059302 RepID=A0A364Y5J8_9BACT|nr:DoxX family protein [Pseudochryseolinea flava]RAW02268.1 DoxX family protein [Pseudochryseolinea flava]
MTTKIDKRRVPQIILWSLQIVLALLLLSGAAMKLLMPIEDLSKMWAWAGEVPPAFVRFIGGVDLLGAVGIVLPLQLAGRFNAMAISGAGIVALMISASIFHIQRGEGSEIGINIVVGFIAAFVAWKRWNAPVDLLRFC